MWRRLGKVTRICWELLASYVGESFVRRGALKKQSHIQLTLSISMEKILYWKEFIILKNDQLTIYYKETNLLKSKIGDLNPREITERIFIIKKTEVEGQTFKIILFIFKAGFFQSSMAYLTLIYVYLYMVYTLHCTILDIHSIFDK